MPIHLPTSRRAILRRATGGGAVLCAVSAGLDRLPARAAATPSIVVDPGHGGRDPGAEGTAGTLEKDVTLAVAMALKASLLARGLYRVELTRSEDRYVALEDRIGMACERGADLFLSLHADKLANPTVRGASVYTLARQASDARTEALANRENGAAEGPVASADGIAPEVSEILASLAGRENRSRSARMARQVVLDFEPALPLLPSPERHANFAVLHAAGIPSVLIEMGFLSNSADEAALNDSGHRDLIARSLTRAVDAWFAPGNRAGAGGKGLRPL
jgi:N-acetylmuramoyl-L-alanine amidase